MRSAFNKDHSQHKDWLAAIVQKRDLIFISKALAKINVSQYSYLPFNEAVGLSFFIHTKKVINKVCLQLIDLQLSRQGFRGIIIDKKGIL